MIFAKLDGDYQAGIINQGVFIWSGLSSLIIGIMITFIFLIFLNFKLPKFNKKKKLWFFSALISTFITVYVMGGSILIGYFASFIDQSNPVALKSIIYSSLFSILFYRILNYIRITIPNKIIKELKKIKELKLVVPYVIKTIKVITNTLLSVILVALMVSLIVLKFTNQITSTLELIKFSRAVMIVAFLIELWFWYGLVQNTYLVKHLKIKK
ncbi:MAG: hypothetical protein KAQ83_03290 [Nanoarchaeota archaeon]|nr:hypothetical protein [Nanoarchaeota archaeon]